ncbi:MAG TPA: hypothetical protein VFF04_01955 [Candidatus Babeliales bacterium]|nr:hypothetical protein [Candidatus Babeliales bacterium]
MNRTIKLLVISLIFAASPFIYTYPGNQSFAADYLYTKDRQPSAALLELLNILSVSHDGSFDSIVAETQKAWLRKPGTERWHLEEICTNNRDVIMALFDQLGCIQKVEPSKQEYDYGIILGATVFRVRTRLTYLLDLWQQGIRFKTLVFLGGQRPLDAQVEPADLLINSAAHGYRYANDSWQFTGTVPSTEYEMMKIVFEQTKFPAGFLENVDIVFVNAPMQQQPDGSLRRPTTVDIINEWLNHTPKAGTCLFVSNQPYVGFQDSSVRTALPVHFNLETVGEAAKSNELIAVHLDNVARWLYQEKQLQNKQ